MHRTTYANSDMIMSEAGVEPAPMMKYPLNKPGRFSTSVHVAIYAARCLEGVMAQGSNKGIARLREGVSDNARTYAVDS